MKSKTFVWLCLALFICSACERETIKPDDPTTFTSSSIVGIWACIASDNLTYDLFTGEQTYHWDYDSNAQTYDVLWYFDIKSDSKVQYVNVKGEDKGEYRKSDGYLHIPAKSEWRTLVDANYIFDQEHQAIRCPCGICTSDGATRCRQMHARMEPQQSFRQRTHPHSQRLCVVYK